MQFAAKPGSGTVPGDGDAGPRTGDATTMRPRWSARMLRRRGMDALVALLDGLIVATAFAVALELRFDGSIPALYAALFRTVIPAVVTIFVGTNLLLRMYWRGWRYASLRDALALAQAAAISTGLTFVADAALFPLYHPLPLSIVPVGGLLALIGMALPRFRHRLFQEVVVAFTRGPRSRVLIIGAGQAGQWLARELLATPALGYRPICFVDDDPEKQGQRIHGLPVAGTCHDIAALVQRFSVEVIVVAIPSLSAEARRDVLARCEATPARVKIMPGLPDLLTSVSDRAMFRDARLEDLLGRPPVVFAGPSESRALAGSVLITGAAGSIGSELARQIASRGPERLILLDIDESRLFDLAVELEAVAGGRKPSIEVAVADVTRGQRVSRLLARVRPTVVFHAAAYKHVPLMETHPEEAVLANVVGTFNVCQAAEQSGCERVVFISTDKAVAPANVMGATKRVGERIVESFSGGSKTVFCTVRFGNVLGSRGSVVPTFARQIREGGPLTITHPEMTRYFMTIPEAVNLIIEASYQAVGGEVFVLDMGDPVAILDLARKMIRLHGLRPGEDVEIQEIGTRPGEKLHEALASSSECLRPTSHPRVSRVVTSEGVPIGRMDAARTVEQLRLLAETGSTDVLVSVLYRLAGRVDGQGPVGQTFDLARQAG